MGIRAVSIGAVLVSLLPGIGRSQEINTTTGGVDSWSGHVFYQQIDNGPNVGWGQVFTVPAATTFLNAFSFWLAVNPFYYGESEFRAHLATWDGGSNTYTDIWASGVRNVTSPGWVTAPTAPLATFGEQVFSPNLAVTAGQTYVAYLRVSNPLSYGSNLVAGDIVAWRATGNAGPNGMVSFWDENVDHFHPDQDAAFTADFTSPVPEPATVLLLATGLIGVGGVALGRRRRQS